MDGELGRTLVIAVRRDPDDAEERRAEAVLLSVAGIQEPIVG